jgi:sodium-coupled neutral amino acid transporter 11
MVNLARFLFGVNMFTTFPLEAFVAREVIEEYFFAGEFDQTRHLIFTTSLVLSSLIVSLSTCDLGIVLELTGGLSATALAFIFPSICFLKLASDSSASAGAERNVPELTSASSRSRRVGRGSEDADDESDADLSDLEGEAGGGGDFSVDDVELPLRPGASVRQRAPGGKSKWWMSTKPLAVATAIFGCVVLVISGECAAALAGRLVSDARLRSRTGAGRRRKRALGRRAPVLDIDGPRSRGAPHDLGAIA